MAHHTMKLGTLILSAGFAVATHASPPGTPYLGDLAEAHDVVLCSTVKGIALNSDTTYRNFVTSSFQAVKPEYEMKPNTIRTDTGGWNFGPADVVMNYAAANDKYVHGHTLVWYKQGPRWLGNKNASNVEAAMNEHITGVVNRYKNWGGVSNITMAWDVVNEALRDSENTAWPSNIGWERWLRRVGDGNDWSHVSDYIGKAFIKARQLHGSGILLYNDYGIELDDPDNGNEKSDAAYALAQDLISRGIPIDAVGFQCHFTTSNPPDMLHFAENMKRFADLGLSIFITELDVRIDPAADTPQEIAAEESLQADIYWNAVRHALLQPACLDVQFWGFTDEYMSTEPHYADRDPSMLRDAAGGYEAKPAFWAVRDLLRDGVLTGRYRVVNSNSGLVMRVQNAGTQSGALIEQRPYYNYNSYKWEFYLVDGRAYRVRNVNSGMNLHVVGGNDWGLGALLDQNPSYGRWRIEYAGNGAYYLVNANSAGDLHVHVYNGSTTPGELLDQWDSLTAPSMWFIEEAQ